MPPNIFEPDNDNFVCIYEMGMIFSHAKYRPEHQIIEMQKIVNSKRAAEIGRLFYKNGLIEYDESFYVMYLNRNNCFIGYFLTSHGGQSGTVVDIRKIYAHALLAGAQKVIVFHNHPSGSIEPSTQDVQMTKKIIEAGKTLDITVEDHIILTATSYYSFADEGLLGI